MASFDYAFDTIGNLTTHTDHDEGFTEGFCYDSLDRLTSYQITWAASCPRGDTEGAYA